jgi:subtilisin family serine protease
VGFLLNSNSEERTKIRNARLKLVENAKVSVPRPQSIGPSEDLASDQKLPSDRRHDGQPKRRPQPERLKASKGVRIGFIDSGIDPTHPEFDGRTIRYWDGKSLKEETGSAVRDYGSHGTHIASIAAGNSLGRAPGAEIFMAAALTEPDDEGHPGQCGWIDVVVRALDWIRLQADAGTPVADLVNLSLACSRDDDVAALRRAISSLGRNTELGRLIFAAAGNHISGELAVPADMAETVAVGAHTNPPSPLQRSVYSAPKSNNPPQPDIYAPGDSILGAYTPTDSTLHRRDSGTSQACAAVTGEAACEFGLLKQAGDNSGLAAFRLRPESDLDDPDTRLVALPGVAVLKLP